MARRTRFRRENSPGSIARDDRPAACRRPARIAGMEWGTALLAAAACLVFATGTAVITHSVTAPVIAGASIGLGLLVALRILRFSR